GDEPPKYLNSPETPVFHKGRELYGLYEARRTLKKISRLLLVEGYMDAVALAQFGIANVVATLGTATTAEHLEKLLRTTPEVVFAFDGDRAGRDAAWKALETTLPLLRDGRQARFLFLPQGEDPDSLVRRIGAEEFQAMVEKATPLSDFLFDKLGVEVDMTSLDGRARLVTLARPYIDRLPPGVFREMMENRLNKVSGTRKNASRLISRSRRGPQQHQPGTLKPLHRAIALLLQYPHLARLDNLPRGWEKLESKGVRILRQLLEILRDNPHFTAAIVLERWEEESVRRHMGKLAATPLAVFDDEAEQFTGCLRRLSDEARQKALRKVSTKLRPSDMTEEEKAQLRQLYSIKE
ncbi:MAG TPA: toprim domain-containing protein, partial [Chromatiaceae bacterium]|nr:toprim domain-containing protein [Chromatiaceae bacterium]